MDGPGECIELEGFSEVLCMAWKQDNQGPQDPNEANCASYVCLWESLLGSKQRRSPGDHLLHQAS